MSKLTIITAGKHEGKTGYILNLVDKLKAEGKSVCGIISVGYFDKDKRSAFDILNIKTEEKLPFMSIYNNFNSSLKIGSFFVNEQTYIKAKNILRTCKNDACEFCFIDEVGRWELNGGGWKNELADLLKSDKKLIITLRKDYLNEFIDSFNVDDFIILP